MAVVSRKDWVAVAGRTATAKANKRLKAEAKAGGWSPVQFDPTIIIAIITAIIELLQNCPKPEPTPERVQELAAERPNLVMSMATVQARKFLRRDKYFMELSLKERNAAINAVVDSVMDTCAEADEAVVAACMCQVNGQCTL